MSTKLSSATALHEVRAASTTSEVGVSKGGPNEVLGATCIANAESGSDRILYYVDGAGNAIAESGPLYRPVAGDVAVTVPASTGDQTWVYVKVGASGLVRGAVAELTATATHDGVLATAAATAASKLAGVAQHNIAADNFGWILVKGVGVAGCDASVAAGEELDCGGAAGELSDATAGGLKGVALALAAGPGLVAVKLDI